MTPEVLRDRLANRERDCIALPGFAESAVLAAFHAESADTVLEHARLIFTVRHSDLRTHGGQIAFPGGRRDALDDDLVQTALREADEELGIARNRVEVLGLLDDVPTPTGFVITPVVGLVHGALVLTPHADEVAEVFDVSLAELRNDAIYNDAGRRTFHGVDYAMHEYYVGERRIWGATARMVHQLLTLSI